MCHLYLDTDKKKSDTHQLENQFMEENVSHVKE